MDVFQIDLKTLDSLEENLNGGRYQKKLELI
jgi:hypothetical protein